MFPNLGCIPCLVRLRPFDPKVSGKVPIRHPAIYAGLLLLFKVPLVSSEAGFFGIKAERLKCAFWANPKFIKGN